MKTNEKDRHCQLHVRKNGNSELLRKQFEKGALESGNSVQTIFLRDVKPQFCTGLPFLPEYGQMRLKDGVNALLPAVREADVLVFATPVYYYSMSGQFKDLSRQAESSLRRRNKFREVYLLASSAENDRSAMEGTVRGVQGWIDCFSDVRLAGAVYGIGAEEAGSIRRRPPSMRRIKWARASADRRKRGGKNNAGKRI